MAVPRTVSDKDKFGKNQKISGSSFTDKEISKSGYGATLQKDIKILGQAANRNPKTVMSGHEKALKNAANDASYIKQRRAADLIKAGEAADNPSDTKRHKTANRYKHSQEVNTRNVRVSTGPSSPGYQQANQRETTDEKFRKSYANKGLQPTSIDDQPTNKQTRGEQIEYTQPSSISPTPKNVRREKKKSLVSKSKIKIKKKLAKKRAQVANYTIWSWAGYTWLAFQIPFALLNIVFFGLTAAIHALTTLDPSDGAVVTLFKSIGIAITTAANWLAVAVKSLTGLDLSVVNPANLWMLTQMIIMGYAIFVLFLIYLQYKFLLLNPLSGKGHGLKLGAVILAFIGYTIPILNLLPWFIIWTLAVRLHPK